MESNSVIFEWKSFQAPGLAPVSAKVEPGDCYIIFSPDPAISSLFQSATLGWSQAQSGTATLGSTKLQGLKENHRLEQMRKIGVIEKGGGFLGNLCAWENILLSHAYQTGKPTGTLLSLLKDVVQKTGISEIELEKILVSRIDDLSETQRMLLALARESIQKPQIWMLNNSLDDLPTRGLKEVRKMMDRLAKVHKESGWIIFTCEEPVAESFHHSKIIYLEELDTAHPEHSIQYHPNS